jgi:Short C-terminal domain/Phospholipase_D-nuclease N-terminal
MLDIFFSILIFVGWVLWLMLVCWIIWDIFRSPDLSGWGKAGWLVFVVVLPILGVIVYLAARGGQMQDRQSGRIYAAATALGDSEGGSHAADRPNPSDELAKLAGLHQRGVLNDEEYQRAKDRMLV